MRKRSSRSRGKAKFEVSSTVKAILLILLAAAVIVLCFLAIRHGRGTPAPTQTVPSVPSVPSDPAGTPLPGEPAQPGADPNAEASAPAAAIAPSQFLLRPTGPDSAYRAVTGSCPEGGASIDVTADGGATWTSFDVSTKLGIGAIQSLLPQGTSYASFVGLNLQDCASASAGQTYTAGNDWEVAAKVLNTSWYTDPTASGALLAPGKAAVAPPCTPGRIVTDGEDLVAGICADSSVVSSKDAGATWLQSEPIAGIDAVGFTGDVLSVTLLGQPQCADGVTVQTLDEWLWSQRETCVPAGAPAAGQTSLAEGTDGAWWLLAGDRVLRSSDQGASWK